MITFNQVCRELGLEPKAVRAILKSNKPYKIKIKSLHCQDKINALQDLINWWLYKDK